MLCVHVDNENGDDIWWSALRAHADGSEIEAAIDRCIISEEQYHICVSLPGWNGECEFAVKPLVVEAFDEFLASNAKFTASEFAWRFNLELDVAVAFLKKLPGWECKSTVCDAIFSRRDARV